MKKKIFVVLDLGKVKKYLCKLDTAAKNIEVRQSQRITFCPCLAANNGLSVKGGPRHVVDLNAVLLEAVYQFNNPQAEEAQLPEVVVPEPVVEGSRQQEAESPSLAEIVEEIEEDHEVETSTRASRETLTSQSSTPSPEHITGSFNNIEEDLGVGTSTGAGTRASRETSSPSPHWQHIINSFRNTSGVMINKNVGNMYKTNITNVGNNNSVNHYYRWVQAKVSIT